MTPLRLSTRPAARPHSPEAWRYLAEDLEAAAECNRAQEQELEAVRAELRLARQELAEGERKRDLCDDLIGSLYRRAEFHASHAEHAYAELNRAATANRRALDVIRDLRRQLNGPRTTPAAGAVLAHRN